MKIFIYNESQKSAQKSAHTCYKARWRHSINQFSKLQQQSKLICLDTIQRKTSSMKLKMKNRLGQIDEQFFPASLAKKSNKAFKDIDKECRIASTNHQTNVLTTESWGTNLVLQESIIFLNPENEEAQYAPKRIYQCAQVLQNIVQELTQFNKSKYQSEMNQHCTKYNSSIKSKFYSFVNHPKKELYEFCYICDQILTDDSSQNNQRKETGHICRYPIDSFDRVQKALLKLKVYVQEHNNKIFDVFLHNTMQPNVEKDQLVGNVRVLKQSIQHEYQPEQAVLRMRLMNLIGKKIAFLLQQKDLQQKLKSLSRTKSLKHQPACSKGDHLKPNI